MGGRRGVGARAKRGPRMGGLRRPVHKGGAEGGKRAGSQRQTTRGREGERK